MESLDVGGPPSCVEGRVPGLGEVDDFVLLPDPGGGVEGGRCQIGPHDESRLSLQVVNYPPPRGGRSLDHV